LLSLTIAAENALVGTPQSVWALPAAGVDPSIEGFATNISVNQGQQVRFKINTQASAYHIDIYRLGYYDGLGARFVTTLSTHSNPADNQPTPVFDAATLLKDAGNWHTTDIWNVPSDATSGVYFAKLVRDDGGGTTGANGIIFVVRDDTGASDLLFQTSDTTWQAYNRWGGASFYGADGEGSSEGRAYKISYNRPILDLTGQDQFFWAEYPMVRWLESNGYNVSYTTDVDTDRFGNELLEHKVFLSVGHDEYWSGAQRANVEAARDNGVNLAFFSGNEVYWKTRWENSIDGNNTPYRTLVCYKETWANAKIDPLPDVWTGTWRDPRFSPPADGGRPENGLTGTMFTVQDHYGSITVPALQGQSRFWRNTSVAALSPGQVATLAFNTLGYEFNSDLDNGFRPAGLIDLSSTFVNASEKLLDYGSTVGPGTATHSLTLYRAPSGPVGQTHALVFSAGTIQWSWGLDAVHPGPVSVADARMQQATVNLFADMGVQAGTLQAGLVQTTASTDLVQPASLVTSPTPTSIIQTNSTIVIQGTAADSGGGVVAGVEVSTDDGTTWHPAILNATGWSYTWTPTLGAHTIRSRAVDDSLNMEVPSAGVSVNVFADAVTAPQVSNLQVSVIDPYSATISWTTDEASTSVVLYGTTQSTPNTASTAGLTTNHSVTLTGLLPQTIYYFRVRSSDSSANTTTVPATSISPLQFTTRALAVDTTVADFSAGTTGANTSVVGQIAPLDDGSVSLTPTAGSEFLGSSLPGNWATTIWNIGGSVAVSGGQLHGDAAAAYSTATYTAGRSMEFAATFTSDANQHAGFGVDLNNVPWAIFSTRSGGSLYARTYNGATNLDTLIPGNFLGASHLYRIDWSGTNFVYSIDGTVVATHAVTISTPMRPIASDLFASGNKLAVDWIRMGPFAAAGSFLSRIIDAGETVTWGTTSWTATTPAGTSVAISVRTGNTPTPDASWTSFALLSASGTSIDTLARYLQYRADLATDSPSNPDLLPALNNITIDYILPQVATLQSGSPTVPEGSPVSVFFNVPSDPGNLHYSFALTASELATTYAVAGTVNSAAFTFNDNGNNLIFGRVISPDGTFTDSTVSVSVTNVAPTSVISNTGPVAAGAPAMVSFSNPFDPSTVDAGAGFHYSFALSPSGLAASYAAAGISASQAFTFASSGSYTVYGRVFDKDNGVTDYTTTVVVAGKWIDTTLADFSLGTPGTGIFLTDIGGGGVTLAPAAGYDFTGTTLPNGWGATTWDVGGTVTVGNGLLQLNGAAAFPNATFAAGRSLEFSAIFATDANQHVGLGVDLNNAPWAIFSTGSGGGGLLARSFNGTTAIDTPIAGSFTGAAHLYRIDWNSSNIVYLIDGVVVATHNVAISAAMRPIASDYRTAGVGLQVDWMRLGPFPASASFLSRVFDGDTGAAWGTATWSATTPTGTGVAILVRTGNTATPDATWTNFVPLSASGAVVGVTARYLQYRADLTTNSPANPDAIPTLNDITLNYGSSLSPSLVNNGPVAENSSVNATFNVPNNPGNLHYSFALTPSGLATTYATAGTAISAAFTFPDDGSYTIYGRIFNPDGSFTDYTTNAAVNNVAPTATIANDGPVAANSPVTASLTNPSDVSPTDTVAGFHYSFALSSAALATTYAAAGTSASQAFTFTVGGVFTIYGRIFDKDSGFTDYTTSVTVNGPTQVTDTTVADFSAGTPGANTIVISQISPANDGALTLAPAAGSEFTGTALPAGWSSTLWRAGGIATVGGGTLQVDGASAFPTATFSVGRSLEFSATFITAAYQHVGFGVDLNGAPWAIFSTRSGGGLAVRTFNGGTEQVTALSSSLLGSPHRYRIDWNASNIVYSVDGAVVATHNVAISTALRPIASDYFTGDGSLQVDWMQLGPFASSGSFLSRVFDGGGNVAWGAVAWNAATPSGATVALLVRTGNTHTPDGTWTNFVPLSGSGVSVGVVARYLQYRADLTTSSPSDPSAIPSLSDVALTYSPTAGSSLGLARLSGFSSSALRAATTLLTAAPSSPASSPTAAALDSVFASSAGSGSTQIPTTTVKSAIKLSSSGTDFLGNSSLEMTLQQLALQSVTSRRAATPNSRDAVFTPVA
jgi:hypothetical protein